ncbi:MULTISPECIES: hypothetical protein [Streptomyces]|uniref:hypothetical protein n=1 Tax=Streptomyces TaxID=1883 RepID=UPI00199143E8|nr:MULTISPECIES: hypothetical protein [Streptomyces]GGT12423.1 hypothetical protein GCM10010286_42580 [Streptomyces toxytricini]
MITDSPADGGLLEAAVRNNAEWCAAVCPGGAFTADAWTSPHRTPPYYPDAVTLSRGASAAGLAAAVDTAAPGCSVKDSYAVLDLAPAGFEVLFEAQWIHRPAGPPAGTGSSLRWSRVGSPAELAQWEAAWGDGEPAGLFRPGLLAAGIAFLAGRTGDGRIAAGAAANEAAGVVGVSNVFTAAGVPVDEAWSGALDRIAALWPGLPVVGYESGEDLEAAARHGFAPLGPLRVWLHSPA